MWDDEILKVRCNMCMAIFKESEIKIKNDKEYCPICGKSGYLQDMKEEGLSNESTV